jgi:hypothetical protein
MTTAEEDLQDFNLFVRQRLRETDTTNVSLVELMEEWQLRHPTDQQHSENVAAVNAAIEDFKNGDRGKPAGELTRELRESLHRSKE